MRKQFTSSFYYCSVKEVYIQRVFPAKHSKMAFESGASHFLAPQPAALPRRPLTRGLHALPFSLFSRTPPPTPRFPGVPASSFSLGRCKPCQCLSSRLPLVPNGTPSPPPGPPVWRFPPGSPEYFPSLVSGAPASPLQFRTGSWSRPVRDSSSSAVGLLSTPNKGGNPGHPSPAQAPTSNSATRNRHKRSRAPPPCQRQVWVPGAWGERRALLAGQRLREGCCTWLKAQWLFSLGRGCERQGPPRGRVGEGRTQAKVASTLRRGISSQPGKCR